MDIGEVLKETAKKVPVPTIVTIIVYMTFSKVVDADVSDNVLVLVLVLTFIIILVMMVLWRRREKPEKLEKDGQRGESAISDVEIESGDVFIGNKGEFASEKDGSINSITGVRSRNGDVFIGSKSGKK